MKLHLHNWSKWSAPFAFQHTHRKGQACVCLVCGKVKVTTVKSPWNEWLPAELLRSAIKDLI